jgi:HAD superfamily hydrolase (TIGR01490 family)
LNLTLFDLDGTLLPDDSDHAFGEFLVAQGWADRDAWRQRNDGFYAQYQRGDLDITAYVEFATSAWRHRPAADAEALRARFMAEVIEPALRPAALALVAHHQQPGEVTAIVTATNEFVTRPIAAAFGIDHLLALELQRDAQGRVTGAIHGVPTFRDGKVTRVQQWLAQRGWQRHDFDRITFYSDSMNDLPLLEWVSDPVATNPTPALLTIATQRGWRVLNLFEP